MNINFISSPYHSSYVFYLKFFFRVLGGLSILLVYHIYERPIAPDIAFILSIIAIHSVGNFIATNFFIGLFKASIIDINAQSLLELFFAQFSYNLNGIEFHRNEGFFTEPGVLASYLNLCIFFRLFLYPKKIILIFAFIGLFTTFSTTGWVLCLIQIAFFLKKNIFSFWTIFLSFSFLFIFLPYFIYNIENKLAGDYVLSTQMRYYDTITAINIIKSHPITGIGLDTDVYEKKQNLYSPFLLSQYTDRNSTGNTNSILFTISTLGIPLAIIMFIGLLAQNIVKTNQILFLIITIIINFSLPYLMTGLYLFFILSGLVRLFSFFNFKKIS